MAKMKANPNDKLYQCTKAYKSMTDRDVTYRIEMIVPEKTEDNVEKLLEIKTYTFALRDYNFKHLTGIQHFNHPNITDSSKILLNDCINGSTNMSTFNGRTYSAGRDGFDFSDRLETLKTFEVLMDNLAQKAFSVCPVRSNSAVAADYVIQFQESIRPISNPTAPKANAYRSYLFVKTTDITELNGMSCFTGKYSEGDNPCEILRVEKYEGKKLKAILFECNKDRSEVRQEIKSKNQTTIIEAKADELKKDIVKSRKSAERNPDNAKFKNKYAENLYLYPYKSSKYPDAVLLKLRDELRKKRRRCYSGKI